MHCIVDADSQCREEIKVKKKKKKKKKKKMKAALPQLSEAALNKMASEAGVPLDTLLYRMSDATRLNVLNLTQLKGVLKCFRDVLQGTSEKVLLTGNKSALIDRVIHLAERTIPPGLFQAHHRPPAAHQQRRAASCRA